LLARLLEQEERWQEALSVYHIARFLVPGSPTVIRGIQRLVRKMRQGGMPMRADGAIQAVPPPLSTSPTEGKSTSQRSEPEVQESPLAPLASFSESADEAMADDVVSETLAMILEAQKQYEQAAQVYERLSQQHPERAEEFLQKAVQMRLRKSGKSRDK